MKLTSVKALSASVIALGLVVAGAAVPAHAADMTTSATATATGSIGASGTNAYPITVQATTLAAQVTGFGRNELIRVSLPTGWSFVNTANLFTACTGIGLTVSESPAFTVSQCKKTNGANPYAQVTKDNFADNTGIAAGTVVTFIFDTGTLNVAAARDFTIDNATGTPVYNALDTGTATLAAASPSPSASASASASATPSASTSTPTAAGISASASALSETGVNNAQGNRFAFAGLGLVLAGLVALAGIQVVRHRRN